MENKVRRQLFLLDGLLGSCTECELYKNGRYKPHHTEKSSYVIIGESPNNESLVDRSNELLWSLMEKNGFKKEQFLLLYSVNCYTNHEKPTSEQMSQCHKWLDMYINMMMPLRGILLGGFAQQTMLNVNESVIETNGTLGLVRVNNFNTPIIPMVRSIAPTFALYSPKGEGLLSESLMKFKLF